MLLSTLGIWKGTDGCEVVVVDLSSNGKKSVRWLVVELYIALEPPRYIFASYGEKLGVGFPTENFNSTK